MWRIAIAFLIGVGCTFYFLRESQRPNPSQREIPSGAEEPKLKAVQSTGATISRNDPVASARSAQAAVVLQPLKIKIPYGETVIPAGTSLPIVWQDATRVGVKYLDQVQTIPLRGVRLVTVAVASSPSVVATPPKQADELARTRISQAAITCIEPQPRSTRASHSRRNAYPLDDHLCVVSSRLPPPKENHFDRARTFTARAACNSTCVFCCSPGQRRPAIYLQCETASNRAPRSIGSNCRVRDADARRKRNLPQLHKCQIC